MKHFVPMLFLFLLLICPAHPQETTQELRQEEAEDYYRKWLNEDVAFIISSEERSVFESLSTAEEKENFIEQFWFRRDSDPLTARNEFKEEHYRRIAYANEKFTSGFAGWKTDRGRVYIIHGPPDEIVAFASGGTYERPLNEGGGITSAYPFEIWRYRNIDGIGDNVVLEFVDPSMSGEYRLALYPEEKDALLTIPGAGLTFAEQVGLASKHDRPWFRAGSHEEYPIMNYSSRDNPFYRYETFSRTKAPPLVKYNDLKEMISVNISYSDLPFQVHVDYFRLNQEQMIVPINIQIQNSELSYRQEGNRNVARIGIYGAVSGINNRLITEFEEDLVTSLEFNDLEHGLTRDSLYQKVLILDRNQRYKLDLVAKDLISDKVGAKRTGIVPPNFGQDQLGFSSIVLSDSITRLEYIPEQEEMFVLGDIKIRPKLNRSFPADSRMGVYFQLYNCEIDQVSRAPVIDIDYTILQGSEQIQHMLEKEGESIQFLSEQRVVIVKVLDLKGLDPRSYKIKVNVTDRLTGQKAAAEDSFKIFELGK